MPLSGAIIRTSSKPAVITIGDGPLLARHRPCELIQALEPVRDRLLKKYKAAQEALKTADPGRARSPSGPLHPELGRVRSPSGPSHDSARDAAQNELNALVLFKSDMGTFIRLYTFLSQIFDYGNTAVEKRAIFYRRLLPLLEFGRERDTIDLSKVVLTHHHLRNLGKRPMALAGGDNPKLEPLTDAGASALHEKTRV